MTKSELNAILAKQRAAAPTPKEDDTPLWASLVKLGDDIARGLQDMDDYREYLKQQRMAENYKW